MAEDDIREKISKLAGEMKLLVEQNFLKPTSENAEAHKRLQEIRKEVLSYGLMPTWTAALVMDEGEIRLDVTVVVFAPKKDLSPEDQKIYDQWLKDQNGLQ